jgi:LysR family glycine cleavage system transcriptional activator
MLRQLPPLNALRAFESAARNSSFTQAALELCVSQGAISRHVATLEQWLDVKLFTRMNRGIALTPQGRTYFESTKSALDAIELSTRHLKQSPDKDRLKLKLPPTFAMRWLIPRLARFHAQHPDIDVQITTSHQPADFNREDIDVSIYSWADPPTGPEHLHLFGEVLLLVCAPGLLKTAPPLEKPRDLAHHVLLCSLNRPYDWTTILQAAHVSDIDGNGGLKFENAALAYQATIDELGIMVAQLAFVQEDLKSGRLVSPLPLRVPTRRGYYLSSYPAHIKPTRVKIFEEWIKQETATLISNNL